MDTKAAARWTHDKVCVLFGLCVEDDNNFYTRILEELAETEEED